MVHANVALVSRGFLGSAPQKPTVAISLKTLEAYRQLHRACPRLSVQAQVKALCYLHEVPFNKHLVKQFSDAYDVYLDIQYGVNRLVKSAMHRDTPDWRMLNACAPCLYKIEDEPTLKYALLATMDGNQSLKLVDNMFRHGTTREDGRSARTDIWLSPAEVDRFKDEAGKIVHQTADDPGRLDDHSDDIAWLDLPESEDGKLEASVDVCVERWRNAGPEARKKMFALFAMTGIFVCLCRHGQLLILCDMIRSGELAKYPLAIVNKLMEVYGPDVLVGYDIACAFAKTLAKSCLAPDARRLRMAGVVPAFHGHGHNRGCQVNWHPLYMDGVGKEDFEGCERCFSESNSLAPGTRLSSVFHREQAIEEHFQFWGEQKHYDSGNFIYNNYRQALDIIQEDGCVLAALSAELNTSDNDYEEYLRQEREYLRGRKAEPPEKATADQQFRELDFNICHNGYTTKEITRVRTNRTNTTKRYFETDDDCQAYEKELDISVRWTPNSTEYQEACKLLTMRQYQRAVDELERLVVQRLFELTKLGMMLGYKLREKIGKALKARAQAIQKALGRYNEQAARLTPPRAALSWQEVVGMVSLADFDLLREGREDIRQKPWAKHSQRRAMNLYFNIKRAREEITRLNVEIRRLLTHMYDEHVDYHVAVQELASTNPGLVMELKRRWRYRNEINTRIAFKLFKTSQLRGFTGSLHTGQRIGRPVTRNDGIPIPPWAKCLVDTTVAREVDADAAEEDDEIEPLLPGIEFDHDANAYVGFLDDLGRQDVDIRTE
ncbi:uncharacterized protein B0H18DRAFT_878327 [Fomitopsis serialis]|uniref:uncharacterized protein n=1 Tax=Fomitopsis serialis TaxID=139415 RepID=UPI002008808F|nr:uncharacterized protein B0H18DRAFT_878327 [Neoantrodia serialis]KAH9923875.1 hypothetical protein B0H18DRAFT_878327 [Neoantrodia serialis]